MVVVSRATSNSFVADVGSLRAHLWGRLHRGVGIPHISHSFSSLDRRLGRSSPGPGATEAEVEDRRLRGLASRGFSR